MIKIVKGTYGLRVNGLVVPKNKNSEPFEIDPKREKELIDAGIAVAVEAPKKEEPVEEKVTEVAAPEEEPVQVTAKRSGGKKKKK